MLTLPPWKSNPRLDLSAGEWRYVDQLELLQLRSELEEGCKLKTEDVVSYFNGEEPKWRYTVSTSIPKRGAVEVIKNRILQAAQERRMHVTLLLGPGGEGKSTILQQVAIDLTDNSAGVHVLWRQKADAAFDESLIQQLLVKPDSFVLVCDNAALIAEAVFGTARRLNNEPRVNVQFLLASQTTEWQWKKAPPDYQWRRALGESSFALVPIKRLDLKDAQRIVEKWADAGAQGLGVLAAVPEGERARHLMTLAHEEEINNPNEGPLLGAMLSARKDKKTSRGT